VGVHHDQLAKRDFVACCEGVGGRDKPGQGGFRGRNEFGRLPCGT
jgi:hypothetical protein